MTKVIRYRLLFSVLSIALTGCFSNQSFKAFSGSGNDRGGASQNPDSPPPPQRFTCDSSQKPSALERENRRLSSRELRNTIQDLLGPAHFDDAVKETLNNYPSDYIIESPNDFQNAFSYEHANAMILISEAIADKILLSDNDITRFFGSCATAATPSEECLRGILRNFGKKVYRRPLTSEEENGYWTFFKSDLGGSKSDLKYLVVALLNSPQFLYHVEEGGAPVSENGADKVRLTPYEIASRISYAITGSMPDGQLMSLADANKLNTLAEVRVQVDRLLMTERAKEKVKGYFRYWLKLQDAPDVSMLSPEFLSGLSADGLSQEAVSELNNFIEYVVFRKKGSFSDLLTSKEVFPQSQRMASIYGSNMWSGNFNSPPETTQPRRGLFGRVAMMLSANEEADIIGRGVFVRSRLLCDELAAPDVADIEMRNEQVVLDPLIHSHRERVQKFTQPANCMGCHSQINPIGFVFENFDSVGRFRNTERVFNDKGEFVAQHAIIAGATPQIDPGDMAVVSNLSELAQLVDTSQKASACFVKSFNSHNHFAAPLDEKNCFYKSQYEIASDKSQSILTVIAQDVANDYLFWKRLKD